jgi:hypothetical protein
MAHSFGHYGQLAGAKDGRTPLALEGDDAAVNQEQLILIHVAVVGQRPLAEKDAQDQIIELGQFYHRERLGEPGGLLRDADLFERFQFSHSRSSLEYASLVALG